ncbi:MAG: hypothetical protein LBG96_13905 [Tannerella sp.]|nr:hypothetical protein [Tannerella sp.]
MTSLSVTKNSSNTFYWERLICFGTLTLHSARFRLLILQVANEKAITQRREIMKLSDDSEFFMIDIEILYQHITADSEELAKLINIKNMMKDA